MLSLGRGAYVDNREISRFLGKTVFMKERVSGDNRLVYYTVLRVDTYALTILNRDVKQEIVFT